jgi:hypothetical protein
MILVIIAACILICGAGVFFVAEIDSEWLGFTCLTVGVCGGILSILLAIIMLLKFPHKIDDKLAMYREENANIEAKVKATVQAYMNYEKDTYKNLIGTADLTTLLVKYPELNSNELVKAEIDTYVANNNKIKELKEAEIDKKVLAWWLYFGR